MAIAKELIGIIKVNKKIVSGGKIEIAKNMLTKGFNIFE